MEYKSHLKVEILLNQLLAKRNMSVRELARRTGIDASNLNYLVNGKRLRISVDHIEKIADALDIEDISELLKLVKR